MEPAASGRWRTTLSRTAAVFGALAHLPWLLWFLLPAALLVFVGLPGVLGLMASIAAVIALRLPRPARATKRTAAFGLATGLSALGLTAAAQVWPGLIGFGDSEVNGAITMVLVLGLPATLWVVFSLRYSPSPRSANL